MKIKIELTLWQWSQLLLVISGSCYEIIIDCCAHFETPVIFQVQHTGLDWLTPMLPAVGLHGVLVLIAIPVIRVPCGLSQTIGMEPGVIGGGV